MSWLHIVLSHGVGPIVHHPYSRSYMNFISKYPYFSSSLQFLLLCYTPSYGEIFVIVVIISERPTLTPFLRRPLRLYQLAIDGGVIQAIGRLMCQWPGIHESLNIPSVDVDDCSHQFFILFAAFIIVSCTVPKWGAYGGLKPHLIPLFASVLTILPWSSCSTSSLSAILLSRSVSSLLLAGK